MGKVYTSLIKRTARKLLEMHPGEVSEDFERNKELVSKYVDVKSRKLRNQIAGYLTRLVKLSKKAEVLPQEAEVSDEG
ncbi:MAG: 30S ribosomal protein S17e [Sulfolobales archaeon]|nr:30S ribosomal protein S17e [Sulfolobales archaeon]MCX8208216.1 30S ribosomal protein S17e [Sulfolobales archaeon]MDW8010632.1 30S ribosomal protein S17e [Sulfolobales archaeon]